MRYAAIILYFPFGIETNHPVCRHQWELARMEILSHDKWASNRIHTIKIIRLDDVVISPRALRWLYLCRCDCNAQIALTHSCSRNRINFRFSIDTRDTHTHTHVCVYIAQCPIACVQQCIYMYIHSIHTKYRFSLFLFSCVASHGTTAFYHALDIGHGSKQNRLVWN